MKIGYPCINRSIGCTANHTFRLASYSEKRLIETIQKNLVCLKKILEYNVKNNLLFFRISSDLVPFASHPVCKFQWQHHFREYFKNIGDFIKDNKLRISMHPDQFVLINSPRKDVVSRSVAELKYHCSVLDLMKLDKTAKIQIHIGGVYNNKKNAIKNFVLSYKKLSPVVKQRLVIENDDRLYSLKDCISVHEECGIPVLFDAFHHKCLNNNEATRKALIQAGKTWKKTDGVLMTDYSQQEKNKRTGTHINSINIKEFLNFIKQTRGLDFDIMLEIKNKEKSALKALKALNVLFNK